MPLPIARMNDQDLIHLEEVLLKQSFVLEQVKIRKDSIRSDTENSELLNEKAEMDRLE